MDNIKNQRIFIAGHKGLVGSAILRLLKSQGYENILTMTHSELDLTDQLAVKEFISGEKIDEIYLAAAKVGGIYANNTYPADFIYQNLMIQNNVIYHAFQNGVKKILFLGSSCIYPKINAQPMIEDSLMTGKLEPTNEPYAVAKIAGIKLCESLNRQFGISHHIDYRSIMPTNIYGPGDNFHTENGHVIPSLIKRMSEAKKLNSDFIEIWGSGNQKREFMYVDDMARASFMVMNYPKDKFYEIVDPMNSHVNAGVGVDVSVRELAILIAEIVGYKGRLVFDKSKPDGAPEKRLDVSRIQKMGFVPEVDLREGLLRAYKAFLQADS